MSEGREFVYTEVENLWATPAARVSVIRLVWRVTAEGDVPASAKRRMRWMVVRHYAFNPFARVSHYVYSR